MEALQPSVVHLGTNIKGQLKRVYFNIQIQREFQHVNLGGRYVGSFVRGHPHSATILPPLSVSSEVSILGHTVLLKQKIWGPIVFSILQHRQYICQLQP